MRRLSWMFVAAALSMGCGTDGESDPVDDTVDADAVEDVADDVSDAGGDTAVPADRGCDPLDPAFCALPWPSNAYLEPDANRVTGHTLRFGNALPTNASDKPIDGEMFARLDGFDLSSPLITVMPNIDVTGMATEHDTDPSLGADAPIVWLKVTDAGVERVPYWVELDANAGSDAQQAMIVRPAVILSEATHYVVAFRGLVDTSGAPIARSAAFEELVAGDFGDSTRQSRFDALFEILSSEGIDRASLTLAWDFNTASSEALHGRMVTMRDRAYDAAGPDGPELTVLEVEETTVEQDQHIALSLRGTFRVPHFMKSVPTNDPNIPEVWHFNLDDDGQPAQDGWVDADFWVRIPHTALDGTPHGLVLYGHGQNGLGSQVRGGFNSKIAFDHKLIFFACDMWGMSEHDLAGLINLLQDLSRLPRLPDRLHQGVINHALLARGMKHRLGGLEEVASRGIVVDESQLYYSGISQGGIYGATILAVATDLTRGHLGVPGNYYSFLLQRSQNFEPFLLALKFQHRTALSRLIALQSIQLLWSTADPNSYLPRLHRPLPGSPESSVILAPAKGDRQVAVASNEWIVRSDIGVALMANYDDERQVSGATETAYPHVGSGLVLYDFGNPWPAPSVNQPPTSDVPDPHGDGRQADHHNQQMVHFFRTGEIIDVCGGDGCHPD